MERIDLMFDINDDDERGIAPASSSVQISSSNLSLIDVDTIKELCMKVNELENELTEARKVKNELQLKYDELVDILFEKVMKKTPKLTREQQIIKEMFNPSGLWK